MGGKKSNSYLKQLLSLIIKHYTIEGKGMLGKYCLCKHVIVLNFSIYWHHNYNIFNQMVSQWVGFLLMKYLLFLLLDSVGFCHLSRGHVPMHRAIHLFRKIEIQMNGFCKCKFLIANRESCRIPRFHVQPAHKKYCNEEIITIIIND